MNTDFEQYLDAAPPDTVRAYCAAAHELAARGWLEAVAEIGCHAQARATGN